MNKILITNWNRDGARVWFEQVEGNRYRINTDKQYILEYASCNYDKLPDDATEFDFEFDSPYDGHIKGRNLSFDPSGGPYLALGSEVNGYKINRIYHIPGQPGTFFNLEKLA